MTKDKEIEMLKAQLADAVAFIKQVSEWPNGGSTYGQEQIKLSATAFLARHAQAEQQEAHGAQAGDEAATLRLPSEKPYDHSDGPAAFAANFANAAWNHCIAKIKELNPGMNAVVERAQAGEGGETKQ